MQSRLSSTEASTISFSSKDSPLDIKRKATLDEIERWLELDNKSKINAVQNFKIIAGPEWYEYTRAQKLDTSLEGLLSTEDSILIAAFLTTKDNNG